MQLGRIIFLPVVTIEKMLALVLIAGAGAFYGITKATEPPKTVAADGKEAATAEAPGAEPLAAAIQAQDARETGFIAKQVNRKGGSIYAYNQTVLDPDRVNVLKMNDYKSTIADDHAAFTQNNLKTVFDQEYSKPLPQRPLMKMPLMAIPHPGAEVKSGQNVDGKLSLLTSNPYVFAENTGAESKIKQNSGFNLAQTYGSTNAENYQRYNEVRMSWAGLRNPWRLGGVHYNLQSTSTPLDKDQLTGTVPLAHPRSVLEPGGRPTQVTAPPRMVPTARVFNRTVRTGRTH